MIVAHRISTIQHADKIIVLDSGRIIENGTVAQLLAAGGLFSRFYALQLQKKHSGEKPPAERMASRRRRWRVPSGNARRPSRVSCFLFIRKAWLVTHSCPASWHRALATLRGVRECIRSDCQLVRNRETAQLSLRSQNAQGRQVQFDLSSLGRNASHGCIRLTDWDIGKDAKTRRRGRCRVTLVDEDLFLTR